MAQHENIYLQPAFPLRMAELNRKGLRDLYPSEAWSMYRILPQCRSVLDLGCGGSNMLGVVRAINPEIRYVGVDFNPDLISAAQTARGSEAARFVQSDIEAFLRENTETFDCVMTWAVTYALPNFYECFDLVLEKRMGRFFMFDMRVSTLPGTIDDVNLAWSSYGSVRNPYYMHNYGEFLAAIRKHAPASVEIAGYDFPVGTTSWVHPNLRQPTILSVVIETRASEASGQQDPTAWHVRVPPHLQAPIEGA